MLWPPWAVGADTDEPPVLQGPMQPPRSQASAEPGAGGDSGPRRRPLGQHMARPEEGARGSRKGSRSSSSSSSTDEASCHLARKAASQGGQWRCTPSWRPCAMTPALLGQTPCPPRAEEWHSVGVNGLSSERERPRPNAASTVLCTRSVTLDRAERFPIASDSFFLPTFFFAMKTYIFEKLIQWTPFISSPVFMLLIVFSCHISLVNIYGCQDWAKKNIGCIIKFQVADSFSVWAGPMQCSENSNRSGCLVFYLAALLPRTQ